jgi:gluconolactonase
LKSCSGGGRDTIIDTGAWTNMSIEHAARTAADKGYFVVVPEDCCSTMNADWHRASVQYAMTNVAAVTKADEVIAALSFSVLPKRGARFSEKITLKQYLGR